MKILFLEIFISSFLLTTCPDDSICLASLLTPYDSMAESELYKILISFDGLEHDDKIIVASNKNDLNIFSLIVIIRKIKIQKSPEGIEA